ncbi:SpaA isopeptide-forming pilin-related protein [Glutamicibacter sp. NPDC127525]|uniref:SpaA isopeptide-forming pilin-related protein n=1 Tax=unclassified Glutamicibacter TaxID=2627139 RepID=UPI00363B0E76
MALGDVCSAAQASTQILGGFELDGNLCANDAALDDWTTVLTQPSGDDGFDDSTQFTRGASERSWPWGANQVNGTGQASGQADIGRNYAYSTTSDGHVFAFLGFERGTSTGTIRYIVELNAEKNDPAVIPTPIRSDGDLRLSIEQDGNNNLILTGAYMWNASTETWVQQQTLSGFVGATNTQPITGFDGTSTIPVRGFAEIGVDLTALFGEATCTGNYGTLNLRSSSSIPETSNLGDWIAPISLAVPSTCSSVQVEKNWVIDGEEYENGQQPDGIAAALELTGQTSPQFGTGYAKYSNGTDYEANDEITIGESVAQLPAGCTNTPSGDLGDHVLQPGLNSYTVTNTVTCTTLTLEKEVIGEAAATEWTLSADGSSTDLSGVTGSEGVTNVPVAAGQYAISETGPENYQLTDLACEGAVVGDGNTITITAGSKATCVLTNTQEIDLTVTKTWVVNGTEYAHGEQPAGDAELSIDGQAAEFGATSSGHLIGDEVAIEETLTGTLAELCQVTSSTIDGVEGLSATHTMAGTPSPNVVAIVNTVECEQLLTLVKVVDNEDFNGTSTTDDWTLSASGTAGSIEGKSGETDITEASVGVGTYQLAEEGTAAGYEPGTWSCVGTGSGEGATITLELGQEATCTIVNTALPGSASWTKTTVDGVLLAGAEWTLTGPLGDESETIVVTDCMAEGCTGPDMDPAKGKFALADLKWGSYELQETTAPPGYVKDEQIHEFDVTGDALEIELAAITNEQQDGPVLPLTGGIGRDQIYLIGGAILVLGLGIWGAQAFRIRHSRNLG